MAIADTIRRFFGEASDTPRPGPMPDLVPAPGGATVPNRSGFVSGVPDTGFGEGEAASWSAEAQNTDRATFLQDLWEEYIKCVWAYACVSAIARTVTAGGLVMKWDADTGEGDKPIPAKPPAVVAFERLLKFCNPTQDIRQLMRNVVADLQVFGDAFIEVVWFAGIPVALYNQDCPTTWPRTDAHGAVLGYEQETETGQEAKFRPEQIIHISLDSARPSIFGISPVHAAEESIVTWMHLTACIKKMAKRGFPPSVHIDHPAGASEPEVKKHQDQYAARNIGPDNIGTPITTKGGGKVAELRQALIRDMLAAKKDARDEIISTCGVPPAKVGVIESGNLGGGTGSDQNKSFMLDVINPVAELIAEKLQFDLAVRAFGVTGWHVEFPTTDYRDDKIIDDIRDQRIRNGIWTINRARSDVGEPRVAGGDDPVVIARQDIVLVRDLADRSRAGVDSLDPSIGGTSGPGRPGPPPIVGTEPSKGPGGAPDSEMVRAIAAAVVCELYPERVAAAEHSVKLTTTERVRGQLARNYPDEALEWVEDARWEGPLHVSADQLDTDHIESWVASHDGPDVARLRRELRADGRLKPVILVRTPGSHTDAIVDGHHHALAAIREGHPIRAYVGHVDGDEGGWTVMPPRRRREAA